MDISNDSEEDQYFNNRKIITNGMIIQEPIIRLGTSYIDGNIINDSDIFLNVGYDNYIMLYRKYPHFFKYFKECDTKIDKIGMIPGDIELITVGDAHDIKSDIIKSIYYKTFISSNSYLVKEAKGEIKHLVELEDTTTMWIFICIVMVSLLVLSVYIFIVSDSTKNLVTFELQANNKAFI